MATPFSPLSPFLIRLLSEAHRPRFFTRSLEEHGAVASIENDEARDALAKRIDTAQFGKPRRVMWGEMRMVEDPSIEAEQNRFVCSIDLDMLRVC